MDDTHIIPIPRKRYEKLMNEPELRLLCEEKCSVKLVLEGNNTVKIEGESTKVFFSKDVIVAFGRGFAMKECLKLLEDDYGLEIVDLKRFGTSKKNIARLKSRIIGKEGKSIKTIESLSSCKLSVRGNKVAILGKYDELGNVREAILKLIEGKKHSTVYRFLEAANRRKKINSLLWEKKQ